jgi:hypothetical protein
VPVPLPDGRGDLLEEFPLLGGLGDETDPVGVGQVRRIGGPLDDDGLAVGAAPDPVHFGVALVAENADGVSLAVVPGDEAVNPRHPRAGGVEEVESLLFDLLPDRRRHAVRADHHGPRVGDLPGRPDASLLEHLHHLGIVDEGAEGGDGPGTVPGGVESEVHRFAHPKAETRCLGDLDLHE